MRLPTRHPIIFGEVLYDVFPDGNQMLGGAPFNVAWHLQGFGLKPLLVSRIGQDSAGHRLLNTLSNANISPRTIQKDSRYPTGVVQVFAQQDRVRFEIPEKQAYDFIDMDQAVTSLFNVSCHLLYHGTLALRNSISHSTWQTLTKTLNVPIFCDLNLRAPWWDRSLLELCLKTATWLKVNESEMLTIEPRFGKGNQDSILESLCQRYRLELVVVTLGERGALLKRPGRPLVSHTPSSDVQVVDTVGAGDAISAMLIAGLLFKWSDNLMLQRAVHFAAQVCQLQGATTADWKFYQAITSSWGPQII